MPIGVNQRHQNEAVRPATPSGAVWLFVFILLVLGGAIVWVGWAAVRQHHYDYEWHSQTGFVAGWLSQGKFAMLPKAAGGASHGIKDFDGAEAVRMGCGLMAFGAMLALWGFALILSFTRRVSTPDGSRSSQSLAWLSFACLLAAILCIYPPWRSQSIPFFSVMIPMVVFLFVVPEASHTNWARFFFPALIIAMLVTAWLDVNTGTSMAIGFFVSIAVLVHLVMLFPRLLGRLSPETKGFSQ